MARAAADPLHPDGCAADETGLPCPVIDLVGELKIAGVPVRVVIPGVRERRAPGLDGRGEDLPQGPIEAFDGLGLERRCRCFRVDPGFEERLAVARSVAVEAFEAEVRYLKEHGA